MQKFIHLGNQIIIYSEIENMCFKIFGKQYDFTYSLSHSFIYLLSLIHVFINELNE